jgi:hypothetical protein
MISVAAGAAQAELAPPFDTPPFNINVAGPAAGGAGGFFPRPAEGQNNIAVFVNTDSPADRDGGAGSLILDFLPFTDGEGDDFAILTSSLIWGRWLMRR